MIRHTWKRIPKGERERTCVKTELHTHTRDVRWRNNGTARISTDNFCFSLYAWWWLCVCVSIWLNGMHFSTHDISIRCGFYWQFFITHRKLITTTVIIITSLTITIEIKLDRRWCCLSLLSSHFSSFLSVAKRTATTGYEWYFYSLLLILFFIVLTNAIQSAQRLWVRCDTVHSK